MDILGCFREQVFLPEKKNTLKSRNCLNIKKVFLSPLPKEGYSSDAGVFSCQQWVTSRGSGGPYYCLPDTCLGQGEVAAQVDKTGHLAGTTMTPGT